MHEWDTDAYRADEERCKAVLREKHAPFWGYPSCRAGWFGLLDVFFSTVRAVVPAVSEPGFRVRQIKEKFGTLCIYFNAGEPLSDEARRVIAIARRAAEDASLYTCEVCGRRGVLRVRNGWWATRCEDHADGGVPFASKEI